MGFRIPPGTGRDKRSGLAMGLRREGSRPPCLAHCVLRSLAAVRRGVPIKRAPRSAYPGRFCVLAGLLFIGLGADFGTGFVMIFAGLFMIRSGKSRRMNEAAFCGRLVYYTKECSEIEEAQEDEKAPEHGENAAVQPASVLRGAARGLESAEMVEESEDRRPVMEIAGEGEAARDEEQQ